MPFALRFPSCATFDPSLYGSTIPESLIDSVLIQYHHPVFLLCFLKALETFFVRLLYPNMTSVVPEIFAPVKLAVLLIVCTMSDDFVCFPALGASVVLRNVLDIDDPSILILSLSSLG